MKNDDDDAKDATTHQHLFHEYSYNQLFSAADKKNPPIVIGNFTLFRDHSQLSKGL